MVSLVLMTAICLREVAWVGYREVARQLAADLAENV